MSPNSCDADHTGNDYEDLGHPDAEEIIVTAQLAAKIGEIIRERQ